MYGNLTFLIPHRKPKAFLSPENRFVFFLGPSLLEVTLSFLVSLCTIDITKFQV